MNATIKLAVLAALGISGPFLARPVAAADATQPSDNGGLETIVVTAEKRTEDIQTVPASITLLDSKTLENLGATQLSDYAGYIPGLQIQNLGTPGQSTISLRGIAPLGSSATVGTYIDDTPLGSSSLYGASVSNTLDLLPYDFQSFVVLRGPQGTLYGASALGGLIKYVTKQPDLTTSSVEMGADWFFVDDADKPGISGRIRVNLPLITDQLGMTASFSRQDTPGYTNSVETTGAAYQNAFYQQAGRVAFLWTPNDDLSVSVSGINQQINANSGSYVALTTSLQPIYGKLKDNNYVPEPYTNTLNYFTASVDWNVGWADFVSATSYSETRSFSIVDASLIYGAAFPLFGFPTGISQVKYDLSLYKTTQEFRLTSKPSDTFEWLVGTFYTNEDSNQGQDATAQAFDGSSLAGLDPLATVSLPSTYKEYALFGNATYKFSSLFDITGGARWAHNSQDFSQISAGALVPTADVPGSSSQGVWTYSVSPRLHLSADTMLYARVATGYQPGGPNVYLPGVPPSVNSDTLTNYEIGLKTLFDDRRLLIDADVFYIDWHDIQVGAQTSTDIGYITNGGTARSEGLEFSTLYTPIEGLRLGFNLAYTEAVLTEAIPSIYGLDGDTLPNIPKWAGSVTADYSFPLSNNWNARVGSGVRYTGESETAVTHSPNAYPLESYSVVDLNAGVSNERWNIRFFTKNVANKQVYVSESPITDAATGVNTQLRSVPLQPRTVGIGFDLKF
jgi:iron complex outermembrane recepter protein